MEPVEPVLVIDLFPEERAELLTMLRQLVAEEWDMPTPCHGWSVKDIALHLLGDEVGRLSSSRDGFRSAPGPAGNSWDDLVTWLNQWNQVWVEATRRISPRLLCEMLGFTGDEVYHYFRSLDPFSIGAVVSWAGSEPAPVWLDIAREYTERWVHHQQIRDALSTSSRHGLGRPGLKEPRYFAPVLDTFVRALPHTFRDIEANEGAIVELVISGDAGGQWLLVREAGAWTLNKGQAPHPQAQVTIDQEAAWRLFTRGISKDEARGNAIIEGDRTLALKVFDTVAIIA